MANYLLNARFLSRPATGVDRVATELALALQGYLRLEGRDAMEPLALARPQSEIIERETRPAGLLTCPEVKTLPLNGHLWEQIALPWLAQDSWLLNLCNTGPVMRRKQVVMIHDAQIFTQPGSYSRSFRALYHRLLPALGHRAEIVVTVSDFSRRQLEDYGVVPPGKAHVIQNGADHVDRISPDPGILKRHGLRSGRYFLALGSLAPHKNLGMLVAAARARTDGAHRLPLVIAGGGNPSVFQNAGLASGDGVSFVGRVSDEELKALYGHCRALLFPSLTEGFGLPPLEAMRCGAGVVASTGGAIPEACGDAALMLAPEDQKGWTDAMERLGRNASEARVLAETAQAHAATFTWERAARQLLALLSDHHHDTVTTI